MTTAIYPGTFDPITNGHVSIIRSGLLAFDRLIVALLTNPKKKTLFSLEERREMVSEALGDVKDRVEVDSFDGLLVDYADKKNAQVVLRGLRAVADFEYELQMANMNRHLNARVTTVFIMADEAYFYVSSNLVKEVATLGGDVGELVPHSVLPRLSAKLGRKGDS